MRSWSRADQGLQGLAVAITGNWPWLVSLVPPVLSRFRKYPAGQDSAGLICLPVSLSGSHSRELRLPHAERVVPARVGSGMTEVVFRAVTPADSEFCYQLHKAAMGGYVAATWGWDEQAQREFHVRAFSPGRWQIVTLSGTDVCMIDVEYRPGEIYLARIEIHPDHQGRGIGTRLVGALIDEARQNGQDVVLDVLAVNRRAQALYRRLGMREEPSGPGEDNIKIHMRFTPAG